MSDLEKVMISCYGGCEILAAGVTQLAIEKAKQCN